MVAALVAGAAFAQTPVTVQRSIESRSIGDLHYFQNGELRDGPATFSPDGAHFAIITRRGDLANNTNTFELSLYPSAEAAQGSLTPIRTLSYSSKSSRSGIHSLQWNTDGSPMFIAEIGDGAQIVSLAGPSAEPRVRRRAKRRSSRTISTPRTSVSRSLKWQDRKTFGDRGTSMSSMPVRVRRTC